MPKIKFTPGDWTIIPGAIWNEIDAGNHTLVAKAPQIEDAKLIASAPKMYWALREISRHPVFITLSKFDDFRQIQDIALDTLKEMEGE